MNRPFLITCLLIVLFSYASTVRGDGCYFITSESSDLAQTRQEVVMAIHRDASDTADQVTYVLRSLYSGTPSELAWVIPIPATPSNVVAHENDSLFEHLDDQTKPIFMIIQPTSGGMGCTGCGGLMGADQGESGLVTVEASGQAGIFDWDALTSTGSDALVTWLNDNGYNMPTGAQTILDRYIQQEMHFLAVRVNQPGTVQQSDGQIEIPPIQFTCQTTQRFYPVAISQISAATQTEILIYVMADHRAAAANVQNGTIDESAVSYVASSPSLTNYETLFTQKIAELSGTGLITESAFPDYVGDWRDKMPWSQAPAGVLNLDYLTRLRTVISRANMADVDYQFQDAAQDETVFRYFSVVATNDTAAAMIGQPLAALLLFGLLGSIVKRRTKSGR